MVTDPYLWDLGTFPFAPSYSVSKVLNRKGRGGHGHSDEGTYKRNYCSNIKLIKDTPSHVYWRTYLDSDTGNLLRGDSAEVLLPSSVNLLTFVVTYPGSTYLYLPGFPFFNVQYLVNL